MSTSGRVDSSHTTGRQGSGILERLPPQNLDAEKGVLGSLLLDPLLCDDVAIVLRPDDFYSDAHQTIYRHMLEMHDSGGKFDTLLLTEQLGKGDELEAIGGPAYLVELLHSVAVAAHAEYYARIIRDKSTLRSLIHACTEVLRDAYDPAREPRELVAQAEERVFAVRDQRTTDQMASMHDVMVQAFEHIDKRLQQGGATGAPTGFRDLDEMTGGMHESELVILAARPSMGKTALATNIADHVAVESDIPVLFVSLEMAALELAQRMLCSRGRIDGRKFRSGFISGEDRERLMEAGGKLSTSPMYIDDSPSRTVTEIASCARRLDRKRRLGLIVIDYLQLIEPDNPRDPRQEQVAKMARRLKGLAREIKVPVLCLAQLNRQAEATKDNRPRLSHLRESGAIEQDADVVMFVHRDEYYHTREEAQEQDLIGKADLIISKQRNGPVGDVKLTWRQEFTRFENSAGQDEYDEFSDYSEEPSGNF